MFFKRLQHVMPSQLQLFTISCSLQLLFPVNGRRLSLPLFIRMGPRQLVLTVGIFLLCYIKTPRTYVLLPIRYVTELWVLKVIENVITR